MRIIVWELNCVVLGRWIEYVVLCIVRDRMGVIIIKLIINRDKSIRNNVICYDNGVNIDFLLGVLKICKCLFIFKLLN